MKYSEKLKDPRWQKKRLKILEWDEWACQVCFDSENTLTVHHLRYLPGVEPWDHPDDLLLTLCEDCHGYERDTRGSVESDLLEIMKANKFMSQDLRILCQAFMWEKEPHVPSVTACAIRWALQDNKVISEIIDRYLNSLTQKRESVG